MPSPVGHALGGMIAGWTVGGRPTHGWIRPAVILAAVAILPDVDLLWGGHHQATHSLMAIAIVGLAVWIGQAKAWPYTLHVGPGYTLHVGPGFSLAVATSLAAAYASHVFLDLLGADSTPPIGVMLFWPFSSKYFIAPWTPFPAISRRYWLPGFWTHNLSAIGFEIIVLTPLLAATWWIRRSPRRAEVAPERRRI